MRIFAWTIGNGRAPVCCPSCGTAYRERLQLCWITALYSRGCVMESRSPLLSDGQADRRKKTEWKNEHEREEGKKL